MAFNFGIGKEVKKPVSNTGKLGFGIKKKEVKPTNLDIGNTTASTIKNVTLPGGGTYKVNTANPNELIKTERTNYGGFDTKKGYERADIVPVSLGGINASSTNITYEPYSTPEKFKMFIKKLQGKDYIPQTATDYYLKKDILPKYKSGEISLNQARVQAVSYLQTRQSGVKQGVLANLPSAVGDTLKNAGKGVLNFAREATIGASERFGKTLGTAASVIDPVTNKLRNETLKDAQEQVDIYMNLAKQEPNKEKKLKYLEAAKNLSNTQELDIFNRPEYQKTTKQILGEGAEVFLDIATAGTYGGTAKGSFKLAKGTPTVLKPIINATKQPIKQGAKELVKSGLKVGAPLGAAYGVTTAMREDKGIVDTAKSAVIGAAAGATLQAGLGLAAKGVLKAVNVGDIKNIVKTTAPLVEESTQAGTKILANVEKVGDKTIITIDDAIDPTLRKQVNEVLDKQIKSGEVKPITEDDIIKAELKKQESIEVKPIPKTNKQTIDSLEKSVKEQRGIYTLEEKQKLYKDIVKPKVDKLGKVNKDETIIYYQGKGKEGQYVNTVPSEIWGYNVDKNLKVKKVKTSTLLPTGSKYKDAVGYRKLPKPIRNTTKVSSQIKYEPINKPVDNRYKTKYESLLGQPKLARRVEKETVEQGLTESFKGIREYDKVNMKDQSSKVANLINDDPEKAVRIALGKELPTGDVLPESVFIGVKNQALKDGNTDLLIRLATEEGGVAQESTILGQRIKMLDEQSKDDAFRAIREVVNGRRNNIEKKTGKKVKQVITEETNKIKKQISKAKPKVDEWVAFVESIKC